MQCPMKMLNQEFIAKGTLAKVLSSAFIVFSGSGKAERHSRSVPLASKGGGDHGTIDPADLFFLSDIKLNVTGCLWGKMTASDFPARRSGRIRRDY